MLRLLAAVVVLLGVFTWAAAPAAASHVACGDTITEDTTLDADLVDCPGRGLWIFGEGITLDLNGHTIDGSGIEVGIDAGGSGTIRDGVVRDFWVGLAVSGIDVAVRRMAISANAVGIASSGTGVRVEHNTISNNAERGVLLSDAAQNVIRKNVITGNAAGVGLVWSSGNRIEQNEVRANLGDGVHLVGEGGANGNVIEANVASANGDDGIDFNDQVEYPRATP
jgi:parallel beta-helix repeat protein